MLRIINEKQIECNNEIINIGDNVTINSIRNGELTGKLFVIHIPPLNMISIEMKSENGTTARPILINDVMSIKINK
jgi:hypothetical protein